MVVPPPLLDEDKLKLMEIIRLNSFSSVFGINLFKATCRGKISVLGFKNDEIFSPLSFEKTDNTLSEINMLFIDSLKGLLLYWNLFLRPFLI